MCEFRPCCAIPQAHHRQRLHQHAVDQAVLDAAGTVVVHRADGLVVATGLLTGGIRLLSAVACLGQGVEQADELGIGSWFKVAPELCQLL